MEEYQKALNRAYEIICDLDFSSQLECAKQFKIIQEAVDKANKYDEKEKPKKPIRFIDKFYVGPYKCPVCKTIPHTYTQKYCDECGQRLDWSDEVCQQK